MEESSNPGARSLESEDQPNAATRDHKLEDFPSSALLDDAQKPSSFSHRKLYHKCSVGCANFEDHTSTVMEKENASSAGQEAVISTFSDYSSVKESIQDESDVLATVDANFHRLNNSTVHLSQPVGTLPINVTEEQKECSTAGSSVFVLIQPDEKEAENPGSAILNSNIDAPVSRAEGPVIVHSSSTTDKTDAKPDSNLFSLPYILAATTNEERIDGEENRVRVVATVDVSLHSIIKFKDVYRSQTESTLPLDVVVEQKEVTSTQLPALALIQPDEKEVEFPNSTISKCNAQVSRVSDDPVFVDSSSAKDMIQDEPDVEGTLPMDVQQSQAALVLIQPDEMDVEIPGCTVDSSSAKDMTQDESVLSLVDDAKMCFFNGSTYVHQSYPEDTFPMNVVVEQKEASTTQSIASVLIQPDKEVEIPGKSILRSNTEAWVSRESDVGVVLDSSSTKDITQDEPDAIDVNLKSVKNFTDVHQSPSESNLMDVAVEQKEAMATQSLASVLIQPDDKVVEIPETTILKSTVDALISRESDDPIVVDSSSAKNMPQGEPVSGHALVVNKLLPPEQSINFHQSKSKDTVAVDVLVQQKEEPTPEPQPIVVGLSSSAAKVSDVVCQNELQSSVGLHEHSMQSGGNLVANDSSLEGYVDPDPLGAFCQEETTLITSGHAVSCRTSSSLDSETLGSNAKSGMLKPESAKPTTLEQDIGSPPVIGCSGNSQERIDREDNKQQPVPTDSILVGLPSVYPESRVNNDKVQSCSHESKESKTCEDDRSFTFEVGSLPNLSERDSGHRWKTFSIIQSCEPRSNLKISKEKSEESHLGSETECRGTIIKNLEEDNTKQVSGFSTTDKLPISEGEVGKQIPVPMKSAGTDESPCSTHRSVETVKRTQLEEIKHCSYNESNVKASSATSVAAVFNQPFTDLQQVQLRAQIFVYGSLMQGIPPDEACMISAFGEADGGRCLWEGVWRVCAENYQIQKSPFSSYETPLHAHSAIRVSEQVTRCSSFQSKGPGIPSRSGSMIVSSTTTSTLPLPSPIWSVSTHDGLHSSMPRVTHLDFNQALSPLHSHQSSEIRQYTGNNGPWLFQSPRPGPWVGSSQNSTLNATNQSPIIHVTGTIQATPARDSYVPHGINTQIESHKKTTPGNNKSTTIVQKSRKKKGTSVHEEVQPNVVVSETQAGSASVTATSHNISPIHYQIINRSDTEQRAIFSEETCTKIEQAKLQADDAAAFAASAVRHSQGVWSQLATQKASGLVSEVGEKLVSAAVAVAAAANVAKAAAAAAKVASNAALQAKLMADEALNSVRTGKLAQISETDPLDAGMSLEKLTPVSFLKGKDKIHGSSSIITTARGVARRKVEVASAATKRAENLDAIVRAAELAAEAVSQTGTIIAMGEPLPFTFSELVEAGPEGHWKVHHSTTGKLAKASSLHQEENMGSDGFVELNEPSSNKKRTKKTTNESQKVSCSEQPAESEEHLEGDASTSPTDGNEKDHSASNDKQNSIQKGCLVEVIVDEDDLRGVWFSASVLDVQDGKAYVCYNNLVSDEGNGPLKEWILLEGEGDKAPRIRLAHPMSAAKYEGTRKRRREAMGDHAWAVGDHVDAWIRDGWWEGIVTGKSQGDNTRLTVQFPDGSDSSTVRAWDLRPSLVWKDGRWSEWSRSRENALQPEGDTPQVKRQKVGGVEASMDSEVDGKGINKLSKNLSVEDPNKVEESGPLVLSVKDRTFSVGKNGREESSYDALKLKRKGLQKEGSKVVFGVPKPGKKRKFMEVSKHYIKDKDTTSEVNDSIKLAKYLMPQAPRVWRNTPKVESKGKGENYSKPKGLKAVQSQSIQIRSTAERDNSSIKISNGVKPGHGLLSNARAALSNEQNKLKKNRLEVSSYANRNATEKRCVEPSLQPVPVLTYSKKKSTPSGEANLGVKGNLTLAVDQASRSGDSSENTGKTMPDIPEPRRSCRRIQPTSRLLEGLQSSLVISRIPTFSHDKGTKPQHRGASSRGNA